MKRTLTLLFLSLFSLTTFAQITFLSTDIASPGWVNAQQKDTLTGVVNFGNKGVNQVYDFSAFQNNVKDTTFYLTPTSAQLSAVPGATLAVTNDQSTFLFAKNAPTLLDYVGGQTVYSGATLYTVFSPIDTVYKFTTAYGQHYLGTYGFQTTLPGSAVGQSSIYEVRLTNTTTYTDSIDGWGIVRTPVGTYNCLREHRVEHSSTLLEYKLLSISPWANVPTSGSLPNNPVVSTTNTYNYLAKETHGTVITFTYDASGNPATASWSTTPPKPVAKFGETYGTHGLVAFHDSTTGTPVSYSWNFGDNTSISTSQSPNHVYAANGTYYVCLTVTNSSGSSTWCDSVHITNITAAIRPGAANDTASVTQPGTITLNLLANDTNYNAGDTLCISSVWGAQAGWVTTQGCNNVVFHALDSNYTGLDTFYYKVCEQHQPTLCDTAMVVVNVKAHLTAPTPNFTIQSVGCTGRTFVSHTTGADSLSWSFTQLIATNPFDTIIANTGLVAIGSNITPFANSVYLVCLTAKNNIGSAQVCDTVVFTCAGINMIETSRIRLYPNPVTNELKLDLTQIDQSDIGFIQIFDVLGEAMKTLPVNERIATINVSDLSNGVYLVGLIDKTGYRKALSKFQVLR